MRSSLLLVASVLLGAVPVIFGLIRAISTGDDVRYLWVAAAALIGSVVAMRLGRGTPGPAHVSLGRALSAVALGAVCAAATALLIGYRQPGPPSRLCPERSGSALAQVPRWQRSRGSRGRCEMPNFLFRFGYETPVQHRNNEAHGWDDEDSQAVFIECANRCRRGPRMGGLPPLAA